MCIGKEHPALCKGVDIWGLGLYWTIHYPDPVIQVVDRNEKHVGLASYLACVAILTCYQRHGAEKQRYYQSVQQCYLPKNPTLAPSLSLARNDVTNCDLHS